MSESLANLHLKDFSEYLSGSRASEHTTLAFYTDERWCTFYEQLGYLPEDIEQLIVFRDQYLADISQNGKEYYWSRWSDARNQITCYKETLLLIKKEWNIRIVLLPFCFESLYGEK